MVVKQSDSQILLKRYPLINNFQKGMHYGTRKAKKILKPVRFKAARCDAPNRINQSANRK